jgi:hypothetical protein
MRDPSWIRRHLLHVAIAGAFLLLGFGASRVFSQAPGSAAAPSDDPDREILLLQKAALEAEIKAATGHIELATRRLRNAEAGNRAGLHSEDNLLDAEVDILERKAVVARRRAELKEVTIRLDRPPGDPSPTRGGGDVIDELFRRIKDLEVRMDLNDAIRRELRLRSTR